MLRERSACCKSISLQWRDAAFKRRQLWLWLASLTTHLDSCFRLDSMTPTDELPAAIHFYPVVSISSFRDHLLKSTLYISLNATLTSACKDWLIVPSLCLSVIRITATIIFCLAMLLRSSVNRSSLWSIFFVALQPSEGFLLLLSHLPLGRFDSKLFWCYRFFIPSFFLVNPHWALTSQAFLAISLSPAPSHHFGICEANLFALFTADKLLFDCWLIAAAPALHHFEHSSD